MLAGAFDVLNSGTYVLKHQQIANLNGLANGHVHFTQMKKNSVSAHLILL
jgi:hypothetical protein